MARRAAAICPELEHKPTLRRYRGCVAFDPKRAFSAKLQCSAARESWGYPGLSPHHVQRRVPMAPPAVNLLAQLPGRGAAHLRRERLLRLVFAG
jgi:hypothetical protein